MSSGVSLWVEVIVSVLLGVSGLLALTGALGLLRLKDFFQRMHPVALGTTFGTWCACAASIAYFSALHSAPVLHAWLIPVLLSITVPITVLMLARAALFRRRAAGDEDVPAPLTREGASVGAESSGEVAAEAVAAAGIQRRKDALR